MIYLISSKLHFKDFRLLVVSTMYYVLYRDVGELREKAGVGCDCGGNYEDILLHFASAHTLHSNESIKVGSNANAMKDKTHIPTQRCPRAQEPLSFH